MDTHQQHVINLTDPERVAAHVGAFGALLASVAGWLPAVASLVAIVWYLLVIYESRTLQQFLRKRWPGLALDTPPTSTVHPHVVSH